MVVIIRPSFKRFCGDDACRAALFNHLLYWIAQKAKGQSQDKVQRGEVSWYGTAEEIAAGLAESWSVNKVRKEIKLLVESGIMGQRHNPANRWDQTRHYFIGPEHGQAIREACQKYDICLLHLGLRPDVLHLLNLVNAINKNGKCNCQISEMELPNMADRSTKYGDAIPKDTTKVSSKDNNSKDTAKKEEIPPATQPSVSLFSQDEEEFLSWLKEKHVYWKEKDVETVKQQIAFVRDAISTKERLHRYCDHAHAHYQGQKNSKVWLGNLAKQWLLDDFLQAEKATQPFNAPAPLEMASQDDIEALAAEILREYPEIVLSVKSNEYGPYIEMPNGSPYADGVCDAEDWRVLRSDQGRLAQVLEYGRQHVMV
ncbi:MAG TPA: hypothetical protein VHK86_00040, partial [Nitrososphaera sp.]|nr:hypothetical protein [Nitrososphaera sp.]